MIKSFQHKGLERFYKKGIMVGINPQHVKKMRLILAMLNTAKLATDLNAPCLKFHELKGSRQKTYSITVNKDWRITFEFNKGNAYLVDYEDYH